MSETIAELFPIAGSVSYDSRAAVRATCDLTLADPGTLLLPTSPNDPIAPYGNEIRVSRGVTYGNGTEELVSLGIFRIEEVEAVDTPGGLEIRITGSDRAATVSDAKFEVPLNVPRNKPFMDVITEIVDEALGSIPLETDFRFTTDLGVPSLMAEEAEDPWEFVQGLATALGCELYFNDQGALVLAQVPTPGDPPVAEIVEGEGGVLLEASKRWSRIDAFNRVIVTAENSSVIPVRAERTDDILESPTLYGGRFGKVPRFYSNQYITNEQQAEDAAEGILNAELGVTQQIDFGSVVNPTLRVSDVVLIRREKLGITEPHIIDTLTIPLDAETAMTGTTRLVYPGALGSAETPLPEHLLYSPETFFGLAVDGTPQVYF